MKVIYQPPVMDRIREALRKATDEFRTIEKIVLDEDEMAELTLYLNGTRQYLWTSVLAGDVPELKVLGVKIECALP